MKRSAAMTQRRKILLVMVVILSCRVLFFSWGASVKVLVMGRVANFLFDDSSTNSVVVCQNAEIMKELGEEDPTGNEEEENSGPNSIYIDGFIGSPSSTLLKLGGGASNSCECELVSIDCLDSIRCLSQDPMQDIFNGIVTRSILKKRATFWNNTLWNFQDRPIGFSSQYVAMNTWRRWLHSNELPLGLHNVLDPFVNSSAYPFCEERGLKGRACFINRFESKELYGDLEKEAIHEFNCTAPNKRDGAMDLRDGIASKLQQLQNAPLNSTTLDYLLTFSHITRITFNLRRHMHDIYERQLKFVDHRQNNATSHDDILRVAMHLRRGDACRHQKTGYSKNASLLDSGPQYSSVRKCYETHVYMDALKRVIQIAPSDKHVVVYIATDDSQSLMDEIQNQFSELFAVVSWKYVDYSRNIFDYLGGKKFDGTQFIESPDNKNREILGEAAVADIWHLSHGQVFIGHLGSRFGKLSWWQATARHNAFVPFFTVDGHSICCDIDENCGLMAQHVVSMENCIGIFYAMSKYTDNIDPAVYWKDGSSFRPVAAKEERESRRQWTNTAGHL